MNADKTLNEFKKKFGSRILNAKIDRIKHKLKKTYYKTRIWIETDKASFRKMAVFLCELYPLPHFCVISGYDLGEFVELNYHFSLDFGSKLKEKVLSFKIKLDKKDLTIETITDLIPGALISEREIQEMLGVKVKGIPDTRRLFLPDEIPKGVFPWRKDNKGLDKLVRNLHREGK